MLYDEGVTVVLSVLHAGQHVCSKIKNNHLHTCQFAVGSALLLTWDQFQH